MPDGQNRRKLEVKSKRNHLAGPAINSFPVFQHSEQTKPGLSPIVFTPEVKIAVSYISKWMDVSNDKGAKIAGSTKGTARVQKCDFRS